ncbi:MAG: thioredoxin domain-containing protein, partial [Firmicutes bacterium]|nr:thioredoxin domain-containing protein [Bacillota bacterium]
MTAFRFSSGPNRAHEILWRAFGDEAFAEALVHDRPVFLSICAGWCHPCRVMDETAYSHPEVIGLLNRDFVPVRVDADQRPDVNARYNMGGLPSAAVLTPAGSVLTGAGGLAPEDLPALLQDALETYRRHRTALRRLKPRPPAPPRPGPLTIQPYRRVLVLLRQHYGPESGGFVGRSPVPAPEVLELALHRHATGADEGFLRLAVDGLDALSASGLYDPVDGGFFRPNGGDRPFPCNGKTLEDNARLLRLLLLA